MWLRHLLRFGTNKQFSPKWLHVLASTDSEWGKKRVASVDLQVQLKQITEKLEEITKVLQKK